MHPALIAGGVLMILIGSWSLFMVFAPRRAIRLGNAFLFREQPEPRDWYLTYTRVAGIVGAVIGFGIAATFLIGIPAHLAGIEQEKAAEADRADALVERCETLRPLLVDTIIERSDGSIENTAELSALAEEHGLRIDWREGVGSMPALGLVYDTTLPPDELLFGLPDLSGDQCETLRLRN